MPSITLVCQKCLHPAAHAAFEGNNDGLVNFEALERLAAELKRALTDAGWMNQAGGLFCPKCRKEAPS